MTSRPSIGIDLGGTFIKAAIVDSNSGSVLRTVTRPTRDGEWREGVPEFAHGVLLCVEELEHAAGKKELARRALCARSCSRYRHRHSVDAGPDAWH